LLGNNVKIISPINSITAAAIIGCFFIAGCENNVQQVKDLTSKRIGVEQAKQVKIDYSYGGLPKAQLTAPTMLRYQDTIPYSEFPEGIHADFFNATSIIDSKLDAKYARYMESQNIVFLRDSVTVFNIMGDTLHCEELYWDRSKTGHEFYTDKPVRIRTKKQIIDGVGLDASQDFKQWHILQPRGLVNVPNSQFPGN
jgi:LPS export ABC transporter protein LptC